MKIYMVTWFEGGRGVQLNMAGCFRRLVSYSTLATNKRAAALLETYINTGILPSAKGEENASDSQRVVGSAVQDEAGTVQ